MPIIPLVAHHLFPKTGDDQQKVALVVGALAIGGLMVWTDRRRTQAAAAPTLGALDTDPPEWAQAVSKARQRFLRRLRGTGIEYVSAGRFRLPAGEGTALEVVFDKGTLKGDALKRILIAVKKSLPLQAPANRAIFTVERGTLLHVIFTDNAIEAGKAVTLNRNFSPPEAVRP